MKNIDFSKSLKLKTPGDVFWSINDVDNCIEKMQKYPEKNREKIKGMEEHRKKWTGEVQLNHGWMLPAFINSETYLWGRWEYLVSFQSVPMHLAKRLLALRSKKSSQLDEIEKEIANAIITKPIPQISFTFNPRVLKNLKDCLSVIPEKRYYGGISEHEHLNYFLDWFFYGMNHPAYKKIPKEPPGCKNASLRLYQIFDWDAMLCYPYDYMSLLTSEIFNNSKKRQGYFPTPFPVSEMISSVVFSGEDHKIGSELIKVVCEPSVGCGSVLLASSNYSLVAVGYDIDPLLLKCALFNFYFYAPWYAMPLWWTQQQSDLILGDYLANGNYISTNAEYWQWT